MRRWGTPLPAGGERPTRPEAERVRGCRRSSHHVDTPSPSPFGLASQPTRAARPSPRTRGEVKHLPFEIDHARREQT
jgi:hypothetical protein